MTNPHSASMKAAVLDSHNADFAVQAVARPAPSHGQALVHVAASGVNPLDIKIRRGTAAHAKHPLPGILGIDLAGTVESVGSGTSPFQPGDEVYGMTGGVGGVQGSLAEYAVVDTDLLALKPRNISLREAAAMPLIVITAWEGLIDRANIRSGQTLLVQGGGGGVGHVAIQIALARGATVFATGSRKDQTRISHLGATAIDCERVTVEEYVAMYSQGRGFDVVYDTVGGAVLDASFNAVAQFGHVVSTLGWGSHSLAPLSFRAATYSGVFSLLPFLTGEGRAHHGEILRQAATLTEQGKLRPQLDVRRFTLSSVADAHALLEARQSTGKLVIDVSE
jgi:NADPH:quinone reductase-like Zn-dependent oxidoreductase